MTNKYDLIYVDPPWRYESGKTLKKWSIDEHYRTMSLQDLKDMWFMIRELSARNCILYMWTTSPKFAEACEVIAAWGFSYRTCAVWDKKHAGMGHWFRQRHEILTVSIRGRPRCPRDTLREESVFRLRKSRHSEKPDYIRGVLERYHPEAKRIELFARDKYPGWTVWGNQAPKFNTVLFK